MHGTRPSLILGIAQGGGASRRGLGAVLPLVLLLAATPVLPVRAQAPDGGPPASVVVTTEVLGSIVRELVADRADVTTLMESGADPHAWQPSARDAEAVFGADLVVANGLALEEGLLDVLREARASGLPVFEATEHIEPRATGADEADHDDHDDEHAADEEEHPDDDRHAHAAGDPHFWLDPLAMRDVVVALGPVLGSVGIEVDDRVADLVSRLEMLDAEVAAIVAAIPPERRQLVTGHESLGWFADRYGFTVVGTVIPGLTTTGDISARELATLISAIRESGVPAIFTEVGSPQAVADAVAEESGVRMVELRDAQLPASGSYFDLVRDMARVISQTLAE
jgi:zinc/manganese transport system substrate-binding protein